MVAILDGLLPFWCTVVVVVVVQRQITRKWYEIEL